LPASHDFVELVVAGIYEQLMDAQMRDGLAATDPDLHRETIDALECALRGMGRPMVPVGLRDWRRGHRDHRRRTMGGIALDEFVLASSLDDT
jgi:hypothetical protein